MSTHDSSFGDPENQPDGDIAATLEDRFTVLEQIIRDLEPKVREVNRKFTDIFGVRRDGEPWAYLGQDENEEYRVYFTPLDATEALQLVIRIDEVLSLVDDDRPSPSPLYDAGNFVHQVLGEAANCTRVPSTHVKIVRGK